MTSNASLIIAATVACAGAAQGQLVATAQSLHSGVVPAGGDCSVYDNSYSGVSTFGNAAQLFEEAFAGYNIWLGDDFSTSDAYTNLSLSSVGFCGNGCVDPFQVQGFFAQIYDGLPNDPNSTLVLESTGFEFDGVDTWTSSFGDQTLEAGDYHFAFAARNDFGTNGQTYFYQEPQDEGNDGFQWNPGGAFGFPDNLVFITDGDGNPSAPNACIGGEVVAGDPCDAADCNGDGHINGLDVVCTVMLIKNEDMAADCNEDGVLNVLDLVCFIQTFKVCVGN